MICLDIYSIPHLFWPITKAGTQINEKNTLVTALASGEKQIRLIRQQVKFSSRLPCKYRLGQRLLSYSRNTAVVV